MKNSLRMQFRACSREQVQAAMIEVENHFINCTDSESIRQLAAWRKLARKQIAFLDKQKRNNKAKRQLKKGIVLIKAA